MKNKKIIRIITGIIFLIFILGIILFIFKLNIGCLFLKYFHIPCPACGMTRAYKYIFKLDFINAFKYNILSIPLFILILIFIIVYIFSLFTNKKYIERLFHLYTKYPKIILVALLICFIYNINRY